MRRDLRTAAFWVLALGVVLLLLTLAVVLTQKNTITRDQAVATAEIVRAFAQATLNAPGSALDVALTQQQNFDNIAAVQIAATVEMARTNAQMLLNEAVATQNSVLTQDAIWRSQSQFKFEMTVEQWNKDKIAAGTQTAIANYIATQTQSAAATSQWYTDQSRQRQEQRQGPIGFLWMWGLPIFIMLFAGLCLWGFWRWLKKRQNSKRTAKKPIKKLQAPLKPNKPQEMILPSQSDIVNDQGRIMKPDEQIRHWLDEIKRKLLNRYKDDDDNPER